MTAPRLLLIDNVDSFSFMLADTLRVAGAEVTVERHDALDVAAALALGRDGIVISPGPGAPDDAGISVALAAACIDQRKPLLGVCLGHQAIALACGGRVERVAPMHGKIASVRHDATGLFARLPSPFAATRYHSLAVTDVPGALLANAWSDDGTIMAMRHATAPAHGIQFHPESVATAHGAALIAAFVDACR
ncbi:MAG: aminodeoxychorismate/anthranilate synthase component II [Pseudomonadota bacterium]|nr:aminodeoxychorismate/anthranilate synthase component II [Pseudomonadota bacterium]